LRDTTTPMRKANCCSKSRNTSQRSLYNAGQTAMAVGSGN
jgi:hypothetical protein